MTLKYLFEKTVFLFGAGASKDAGCFLSKEMLFDLKKSIFDFDKSQFADIYDFIIKSLLYQHALKNPESKVSEITNIEDFVLALQQMIDREYIVPPPLVGNWNNKITLWEAQDKEIFENFLKFTENCLINKWTKFNYNKAQELLNPFSKLTQSDEKFDLKIFSLNYDVMVESILNNENEHIVDTGFSQNQWDGNFNDPESPAKLKLYKLHGSVNWYFDEKKEQVKQMNEDDVGKINPLIIFGSGPKMQSYDPFLMLLGAFSEILKSANLFIVVGYSFQDRYINNILIQSLSSDVNKKMLVVDPYIKTDKKNFIKKIEQFQDFKSIYEKMNLTKISPDKIEIKPFTGKDFFNEYLKENCQKLKDELKLVEKGETVF